MLRAALAFLALPTVVSGLIPWALASTSASVGFSTSFGAAPMSVGFVILVASAVSFWRRGEGTLAPWDPPKHLVIQDLYRFNRNPMYIGVVLMVLGWALLSGAVGCWAWALFVPGAFHLRVVLYEEPEMLKMFGSEWRRYRAEVPRWGIRLRPSNDAR